MPADGSPPCGKQDANANGGADRRNRNRQKQCLVILDANLGEDYRGGRALTSGRPLQAPARYTGHKTGQMADQTAPFVRLTAQARYPEHWCERM